MITIYKAKITRIITIIKVSLALMILIKMINYDVGEIRYTELMKETEKGTRESERERARKKTKRKARIDENGRKSKPSERMRR